MNVEKALMEAYGEWQRLAGAEGKAIRLRNWNFLLECQAVIKKLQPLITRLTRETRAEWQRSGADLAAKEKAIRAVVTGLIEQVKRNQSLLKAVREAANEKRAQLEQSRQNLKRLQQSYVIGRQTAWTSFS